MEFGNVKLYGGKRFLPTWSCRFIACWREKDDDSWKNNK